MIENYEKSNENSNSGNTASSSSRGRTNIQVVDDTQETAGTQAKSGCC
jgi:hypothetical protein